MGVPYISLILSSAFYILLGLWWHLQTAKKYWSCQQQRANFTSTATFSCCQRCRNFSVEGLVKLVGCAVICIWCIIQIQSQETKSEQNLAIGQLTVFLLFAVSSIIDLARRWCDRMIFPGLDYFSLVICFNVQSVVLIYHVPSAGTWVSVADTCAMYAASAAAVALLLEFKYSSAVWLPLLRSFSILLLGTWFAHIFFMRLSVGERTPFFDIEVPLVENKTVTGQKDSTGLPVEDMEEMTPVQKNFALVSMMFMWHCLFNVNFLTILWVATNKLASRGLCVCLPDEEKVNHFENRVHFDYHMITRMTDSDCEQ